MAEECFKIAVEQRRNGRIESVFIHVASLQFSWEKKGVYIKKKGLTPTELVWYTTRRRFLVLEHQYDRREVM